MGSAPERDSASSRSNAAARADFCSSLPKVSDLGSFESMLAHDFFAHAPLGAMMVARSAESGSRRS
jgi:hypothetical protein